MTYILNTRHITRVRRVAVAGFLLMAGAAIIPATQVFAEDCTTTLPGTNCTLDENTSAALTIDSGTTLSVGASVNIDHTIDGDDSTGDGAIDTFGGPNNITQSADIGATTPIDSLTIGDDNTWTSSAAINTDNSGSDINLGAADGGETLNFIDGASYSGEIDGHNGDTLNFGSDSNGGTFVTGGQIETVSVIITSGSLDVRNNVGGGIALGGFSVLSGTSVDMNANVTTDGVLDNDGTITIGSGNTLSANTYTADTAAGTFIFEVSRDSGTTETGQLSVSAGGPLDLSNDNVVIAIGNRTEALVDETIANAIIGNTAATVGPNMFQDNSFLYNFSLQANGNNYDLVITVNPLSSSATTANNLNVAQTLLNNLGAIDNNEINTVQATLGNASSSSSFNETLESLQPTVDRGYVESSLNTRRVVTQNINRMVDRLHINPAPLQNLEPAAGNSLVSGSKDYISGKVKRTVSNNKIKYKRPQSSKGRLWINPYVHNKSQSKLDGIDGYDLNGQGVVIGADTGNMRDGSVLGIAAVAGQSDVESKNANRTETDISTYGVSVYGGTRFVKNTVLSGSVSYLHNSNEAVRRNVGQNTSNSISSDFSNQHFAMQSRISRPYEHKNGVQIIPNVSLTYDYLDTETYTEKGTSELSLKVRTEDIHKLSAGVGVRALTEQTTYNGIKVQPSAYLDYHYDITNDGVRTDSNFRNNETERFKTNSPDPQKHQFNLGGDVSAEITENWHLETGYDFEYKNKQAGHTGYINAVREFSIDR